MTDYSAEFEDVRRAIFDVEKGLQSSKYNESQILREMYGDKFIFEYQAYVDGAYEWTTGRRERKNRRGLVEDYRKSQVREGNSGNGSKNLRDECNDKSGKISSEYGEIKPSLDWVDFAEVQEKERSAASKTQNLHPLICSSLKMTREQTSVLCLITVYPIQRKCQDYVYSIRLWENKKIKCRHPSDPQKMSSVNLGAQHFIDNIPQRSYSVNSSP